MLPAEFSIIATMRMPEATLPLQWDLFKIADGHIQYRLVVDGSNRSIRFTVSDNNKYEIIRAEDWFQNGSNGDVGDYRMWQYLGHQHKVEQPLPT